ncbi:relaxase/mobilization nuclease domain-containing protein [Corynebacterium glyciniphilum]|uniref:relaxase/mobilization nuclease domain-containing protein n=1 Tax=Corynebacterium glyciniphilum TaxID=1404244 RepID=UPI00264A4E92|nr:relaxase/mobilization nuclease domain-containing protein [Corynebacterium glyciniphilum]MDN6704568.1 relaxase/mobilization nuclease domain-containing protein [Corynebacterium glyciniphilum]
MSTTHIKKVANSFAAVDYQLYGSKHTDRYRNNKRLGTDRVAALSMDAESTDQFIDRAQALAEANGRKVEVLSILQSFEKTEMDPDDPDDVQKVNAMGYALAKKMYPNSDCHVVTHTDGHGGHAHNHILVINHDDRTGLAIKHNTMHWQVARHNDQLMRDNGLSVVTPDASKDRARYWELERDGASVTEFERRLGDTISEVLYDSEVVDLDGYRDALGSRGIELIEKRRPIPASKDGNKPEHESVGFTYKMLDDSGDKPRSRRRKASSLSTEFTHSAVAVTLDEKMLDRTVYADHEDRDASEDTPVVVEEVDESTPPMHHSPAGDDGPVLAPESMEPVPNVLPEPVEGLPANGAMAEMQRREEAEQAEAEEDKQRAASVREKLAQQRQARRDAAGPDPVEQHTERLQVVKRETPTVDVDAELADVLSQSSDAYVRAAVSLPVKGGTVDDAVRGRLRQRAAAGTLPEDRTTAYEAEVKAFGPKVEAAVEKKAHRAWGDVYGAWGTRPGRMSETTYRSKRYDGPGSGRVSKLQSQMRASAEKGREVDRTKRRGLGE